jgi:glycosyltransferase involved in cell wall biosynthesis
MTSSLLAAGLRKLAGTLTPVPAPLLLLDLTHTSHTRARTGDPARRAARCAGRWRARALSRSASTPTSPPGARLSRGRSVTSRPPCAAGARGSRWPLRARITGRLRRLSGRASPLAPGSAGGVLVPEIFSPEVAAALPGLFAAAEGARVALFHDALALQYPEFTPRLNVARFPAYLQELLQFDGIAAVSEASPRLPARLLALARRHPTPSGGRTAPRDRPGARRGRATPPGGVPVVLCVGSIEGRKNHAALLDACETLWSAGAAFELRLVGLSNPETGAAALEKLRRLRASGRPVRHDGPVSDQALEAAYRQCAFTVYPSIAEGFGLPVAESLARGKPCLCRTEGALGEVARGGGCLSLGAAGRPRSPPPSAACWPPPPNGPRSRARPGAAGSSPGGTTPPSFSPGRAPCAVTHKKFGMR